MLSAVAVTVAAALLAADPERVVVVEVRSDAAADETVRALLKSTLASYGTDAALAFPSTPNIAPRAELDLATSEIARAKDLALELRYAEAAQLYTSARERLLHTLTIGGVDDEAAVALAECGTFLAATQVLGGDRAAALDAFRATLAVAPGGTLPVGLFSPEVEQVFHLAATSMPAPQALRWSGVPAGARVVVDGIVRTRPPDALPPGRHALRVDADGYDAWGLVHDVAPGSAAIVVAPRPTRAAVAALEGAARAATRSELEVAAALALSHGDVREVLFWRAARTDTPGLLVSVWSVARDSQGVSWSWWPPDVLVKPDALRMLVAVARAHAAEPTRVGPEPARLQVTFADIPLGVARVVDDASPPAAAAPSLAPSPPPSAVAHAPPPAPLPQPASDAAPGPEAGLEESDAALPWTWIAVGGGAAVLGAVAIVAGIVVWAWPPEHVEGDRVLRVRAAVEQP